MNKTSGLADVLPRLLLAALVLIAGGCGGEQPPTSEMPEGEVDGPLTVGVFTFTLPTQWELASAADQRGARKEVEGSVRQMIESYSGEQATEGFLGVDAFKAVRLPVGGGWFIVYTVRIPPQENYLKTMDLEQREKLDWGKRQGIVTNVLEHDVVKLGGADVIKVDAQMRQGARSVSWYYWAEQNPGRVGTISVVLNPGHDEAIVGQLDELMASITIE